MCCQWLREDWRAEWKTSNKIFKFVLFVYFLLEFQENHVEGCHLITSGLTESNKWQLLASHNKLRAKVANGQQSWQPSAANMKELRWDDGLAARAQAWANTCSSGHDSNANRRTGRYPSVGQNYYSFSSWGNGFEDYYSNGNIYSAVQAWYDEVENFDRNNIEYFQSDYNTGHYSQVVWAETEAIGCGQVTFYNGEWKEQHIICNYAPAGNFIGSTVYIEGYPASRCARGRSSSYPGLCRS